MPKNGKTLSVLPFHQDTNAELHADFETAESYIKSGLNDNNFLNYIYSLVPDNLLTNNCKYYTGEELCKINKNDKPDNSFKLIQHNIRSLELHFGEFLH